MGVWIVLVLSMACDDPASLPQYSIEIVSGADQVSGQGAALPQPIVVRVLKDGQPAPNTEVYWNAIEGGGAVAESPTRTNEQGTASIQWTLGNDPGQQLLLVRAGNASLTVRASGTFRIASVVAGFRHKCALSTQGEAFCWGNNQNGQLGDGTETNRATPVKVATHLRFVRLTAGWSHTCGLAQGDLAYCWGDNTAGQLGIAAEQPRSHAPTAVSGSDSFKSLSAGFVHTCGVTHEGVIRCWGDNSRAQSAASGTSGFVEVSAGEFHTCARATDNGIACWGWNSAGELGSNAAIDAQLGSATRVAGGTTFATVAAGVRHTCALATNGVPYCWGRNATGETGLDPLIYTSAPVAIPNAPMFTALGTGNAHTCGISSGTVYCWGNVLGNGTTAATRLPTPISSAKQFSTLAVGFDSACALSGEELWCWGADTPTPVRIAFP